MTDADDIPEAESRANDDWAERKLFLPVRRWAVKSLLVGNDTGCFTLDQYRKAYAAQVNAMFGRPADTEPAIRVSDETVRACIESTGLATEIVPGVWVQKPRDK